MLVAVRKGGQVLVAVRVVWDSKRLASLWRLARGRSSIRQTERRDVRVSWIRVCCFFEEGKPNAISGSSSSHNGQWHRPG